jgi:circadian clock protein KaiB
MAKNPLNKDESEKTGYLLQLYIAGATARSRRAITNIKEICDEHLKGKYYLEVIDIYQNPENIAEDNVIAAPTLIKKNPLPVRRFIGDLSDTGKLMDGLAIKKNAA